MLASQGPTCASKDPGAMTRAMEAMRSPRAGAPALRVAVVREGRILEERIFTGGRSVRVGRAEGNDLTLEGPVGPQRLTLFESGPEGPVLRLTPDLEGRLAGVDGEAAARPLGDLWPRAAGRGSLRRLPLPERAHGKLVFGETTLLFQRVVAPPITPRPALPASVRGGFVAAIDWLFTACVVGAYGLFMGGVVYLENADWPVAAGALSLSPAVAEMIFSEPEPPPESLTPPTSPADPQAEPAPPDPRERAEARPSARPRSRREAPASSSAPDPEAHARIAAEAARQAEAMLIGALGPDGALPDVLQGGAAPADVEDVMAQAEGIRVADRGPADRLRRRTGGAPAGRPRFGFHTSEPASEVAEGSDLHEVEVHPVVTLEPGGGDTGGVGDLPADVVTRTIRRHVRAIQRCYERMLSHSPTLEGKITVAFTVTEAGTVSRSRAVENTTGDAALGRCVAATLGRLRFHPGPVGGSVDFSYPFVFAPQR